MEEFLAVGRNLDLFYYCFDVSIPEEYGKRIIQESGHFDYDPNLDDYFTVDAVTGEFEVTADETSFVSLLITDGSGTLHCGGEQVTFRKGDSLFLPAGSGTFSIKGAYQALQTTV